MAPKHIGNIERRGGETLRGVQHFIGRNEQKHRLGIDEAPDKPGARDAIDLGARTRYPYGASLDVARRQVLRGDEWLTGLPPRGVAAFERFGRYTGMTQPCRDTLAQGTTVFANDNGGSFADSSDQTVGLSVRSRNRTRNEVRIADKSIVRPHVDEQRTVGQADKAGELKNSDFSG